MPARIKQKLIHAVWDSPEKMPAAKLIKEAARQNHVPKALVKQAIRKLVGAGELQYTSFYGTSFLEPSFNRPVRISSRVVLKPPDKAYQAQPGEAVVSLAGGAAFGNGTHPTTWLVLNAIDKVLEACFPNPAVPAAGLDVGTGTGVLAIALAGLGVQKVVGTDIDACAVCEAQHNVYLNGLCERVTITDIPVEDLKDTYAIILANLALPTLRRMAAVLAVKLAGGGALILSGFKEDATCELVETYGRFGLELFRQEFRREWGCVTLKYRLPEKIF